MSNFDRFSIDHDVLPVDFRGLQCDARFRAGRGGRKAPTSAALGWLACRKKAIFTDHAALRGSRREGRPQKGLDTGLELEVRWPQIGSGNRTNHGAVLEPHDAF